MALKSRLPSFFMEFGVLTSVSELVGEHQGILFRKFFFKLMFLFKRLKSGECNGFTLA